MAVRSPSDDSDPDADTNRPTETAPNYAAARAACDYPECTRCTAGAQTAVYDLADRRLHPYCHDCADYKIHDGGREYGLAAYATATGSWTVNPPSWVRERGPGRVEYTLGDSPNTPTAWVRAVESRHHQSTVYLPDER